MLSPENYAGRINGPITKSWPIVIGGEWFGSAFIILAIHFVFAFFYFVFVGIFLRKRLSLPELGTTSNESGIMCGPVKQVSSLHLTYFFFSPLLLFPFFFFVVLICVVGILTCHLSYSFYHSWLTACS